MSRQRRRRTHRHGKKLFGGRYTAEEVHQHLAFPPTARCQMCSRRPMTRVIVMAPLDEAKKRMPGLEEVMLADPEGFMQNIIMIKESKDDQLGKPYFRCSVVYACKECTPALEKQAAKGPSWCIVEINRGPGPDKPIAGVA